MHKKTGCVEKHRMLLVGGGGESRIVMLCL